MRPDLPVFNTFRTGDGKLSFKTFQPQDDHCFRFAPGDSQPAGNSFPAIQSHHDRTLAAIESRTFCGQRPAVFLTLYRRKGHGFCLIASADCKLCVSRYFGCFNNVGDLSCVAGIAAGEQIEGQVVFPGSSKYIISYRTAAGRQITHIADTRNAVLYGAVNLIPCRIEPGKRRDVDIGVLLLHQSNHGIQVDFTCSSGLHGAAQHMCILKGGFKHSGVVPFGSFDPPGVGTPVVQCDFHINRSSRHLELPREVEHLTMILNQLGSVPVLVGQHHIALVVGYLAGSSQHFIRIDRTGLTVFAISDIDDVYARIIRLDCFAIKNNILQRQLCGDAALLQVFKQQLVFRAFGGEHVVGLHWKIGQDITRPVIRILHGTFPQFIQIIVLHHAHGHSISCIVQRPSIAP